MKWVTNFEYFKESKNNESKSIVSEICIIMTLLNNEFLDDLLDRGNKSRYTTDTSTFITDLKNLVLAKNRLKLGKLSDGKFIGDDEISKVNSIFNTKFDIEKDWNILINSRNSARAIIDKLLPDEKLTPERISTIWWTSPNKDTEIHEDIVIELTDGVQYSIVLNKNISLQKTSSFSTFADELIGDVSLIYSEEYMKRWDKLVQNWIRIIYENSNKTFQKHIEKFIDPLRIDGIGYFEFFDIRHRDPRFKYLGEMIGELDKNILKFSDLLNEIWKRGESVFTNFEKASNEWNEAKIVLLNSKILEHLFTTSLKKDKAGDITKMGDGYKLSTGVVKMKLLKTLVEKMGCLERDIYYLSKGGDDFLKIPSREFFRNHYDDLDVLFDYHVKFKTSPEEDGNKFNFKIKINKGDDTLMTLSIVIGFSGGEFSSKINAKYKFDVPDNFNYIVSKISDNYE
jgi:hypothetical protein